MLIRAGWPKIAAEGGALADPMCGVGTFLVEAALMAADIAPNLRRERWGFSNWLGHVPALWRKLHEEAQQRAAAGLARPPLWIRGYEADLGGLRANYLLLAQRTPNPFDLAVLRSFRMPVQL